MNMKATFTVVMNTAYSKQGKQGLKEKNFLIFSNV